MQGWGWQKVHHPSELERVVKHFRHSIEQGELWEDTFPLLGKDGKYRWFLSRAIPIHDQQGKIVRWFGTNTDIDKLRQTEIERDRVLELEQTARAEAERANRIKDEFLAILSHELRSPLNPILGWVQLLKTQQLDSQRTAQGLAIIEKNVKLQTQLIDDLLDVAKILRGKLSLNAFPLNLVSVINSALETVRTAAAAKSILLESNLPNIGQVSADSTRLQQVIWNLLSVELPRLNSESETERINKLKEVTSDLRGIKVLCIDDEPDTLELLEILLTHYGAIVTTVASGAEFLSTIESFQPDILISDIGMPEIDGYTLLQQVRSLPPERGGQTPAIALTAFAGEIDRQKALNVGFKRHLAKPVEPNHLIQAVLAVFEANLSTKD